MTTRLTWNVAEGAQVAAVPGEEGGVGAGGAEEGAEEGQSAGGGARDGAAGGAAGAGGGEGPQIVGGLAADEADGHAQDAEGQEDARPRWTSSARGPGTPACVVVSTYRPAVAAASGRWRICALVSGLGVWMSQAAGTGAGRGPAWRRWSRGSGGGGVERQLPDLDLRWVGGSASWSRVWPGPVPGTAGRRRSAGREVASG